MLTYPITVTIDTNIFDAAKYDFSESSPLSLLKKYVQNGKIKVVLSNIVIQEAKKHIAEQVSKLCGIARKMRAEAIKESNEYLINYVELDRLLQLVGDKNGLKAKGVELFEEFINDIDAEILDTGLINLDAIINDYFAIRPPFEEGEKKRKEFPDAFIACQIRERFREDEVVAIISKDGGVRKACGETANHIFFDSLGQLYDTINREEIAYDETIKIVKKLQFCINSKVSEHIKSNENIDVRGLSYDKDGIESGFDYDEFYLQDISNLSFEVGSIDEISDKSLVATLLCHANMSVNCYYEDYDNAPWDSETKEYVFVDTIKMRENHDVRFVCTVEINRETEEIKVFPFTVILGGDSRKERYQIYGPDYEQELQDRDRESIGFNSLGSYESYLEEDLPGSAMAQKITEQFEEMNDLYRSFEPFSVSYDLLLEKLNDTDSVRKIIKLIAEPLGKIADFPSVINEDSISDDEIEEIKEWAKYKGESMVKIAGEYRLPDVINYGDSIAIKGVDGSEILLSIDEIMISPTEGAEEYIALYLSIGQEKIARGGVKLTIGYLHFDEDGGAADGTSDGIEYDYHEIVEKIGDYIREQREKLANESEIADIIEGAINSL